jgi:hypothetical protein
MGLLHWLLEQALYSWLGFQGVALPELFYMDEGMRWGSS